MAVWSLFEKFRLAVFVIIGIAIFGVFFIRVVLFIVLSAISAIIRFPCPLISVVQLQQLSFPSRAGAAP